MLAFLIGTLIFSYYLIKVWVSVPFEEVLTSPLLLIYGVSCSAFVQSGVLNACVWSQSFTRGDVGRRVTHGGCSIQELQCVVGKWICQVRGSHISSSQQPAGEKLYFSVNLLNKINQSDSLSMFKTTHLSSAIHRQFFLENWQQEHVWHWVCFWISWVQVVESNWFSCLQPTCLVKLILFPHICITTFTCSC